jgi:DNA-binding MarR family transcriptional regulator
MRLLWAVGHGLQKTSKDMARRLGVTGPQRLGLRLVERFPGISPGELAGLLQLHPSTLSGVLLRLERHALIERHPSVTDRRRSHLYLTAKGRRANKPTAGTVETGVKTVLVRLGERRIAPAREVLAALAEQLLNSRPKTESARAGASPSTVVNKRGTNEYDHTRSVRSTRHEWRNA